MYFCVKVPDTMNKRFFFAALLLLFIGASVQAQNNADVVKSVRAAYNAAKEKIKLTQSEGGAPRNDAVVTMHYNVPGTGPRTTVAHCYFELDDDEYGAHYYPYFITLKYNIAAREFYEEYLFHPESGRLLFAFIQSDTYEGTKNEERYYYDDLGKLASANIKGERTIEDAALVGRAEDYRAFIPKYLDFPY